MHICDNVYIIKIHKMSKIIERLLYRRRSSLNKYVAYPAPFSFGRICFVVLVARKGGEIS